MAVTVVIAVAPGDGRATPDTRCARLKVAATALAARAQLRAEGRGAVDVSRRQTIRTRLEQTFARANAKGSCGGAGDVAAIEHALDTCVADVLAALAGGTATTTTTATTIPFTLSGSWRLVGAISGGDCEGSSPAFLSGLEITSSGTSLTGRGGPPDVELSGTVTATSFDLDGYFGAVDCGTAAGYDEDWSVHGVLPPDDGKIAVTQKYGHSPVVGTCPPCGVTWTGTMTR